MLSYSPIPDYLIGTLESKYPIHTRPTPGNANKIHYVIVLGGGCIADTRFPSTSQLNMISLVRLVEGIKVYRENPGSKLILSGGNVLGTPASATIMKTVAVDLGVDQNDIILEKQSNDTRSSVLFLKQIIGNAPHVLVTSAFHMPRSMLLFQKAGLSPIAAPTNHMIKNKNGVRVGAFFPYATNMKKTELVAHEYLGILWAKISL